MLDAATERTTDDPAGGHTLADHAAWLSQSEGLAWVVLGELERKAGWLISIVRPFAGVIDDEGTDGVLVLLRHRCLGDVEIRVTGRRVDDCVARILVETDKYIRKIVNAERRERDELRAVSG